VPDNTRVAVIKACLYEPQVNRTYAEMAAHYDTAILPARPRRPRDKAKVEVAVLIIERWLLGRLRHRRFYSLAELNATISELLRQLNDERPIRRLGVTRRTLFEELDRPNLNSLPAQPYCFAEWRLRRVGVDYHVELEGHFYSVPYRFARSEVEVRLTPRTVEIFLKGERIAAHLRASGNYRHTTVPEHMPSSHRRYADWTVERIRREAALIGPATAALCELILERRPHPEQGFRACLGIVRLVRPFGANRLEAAATRARDRQHPDLRLGALDPRQQARSPGGAPADRQWCTDPPPQYPRTALLPLRRMQLLIHPMLDQLGQLGLSGMAQAFAELAASDQTAALTHADWFALLVDRELTHRRDKRLAARLRYARLRQPASIEDVDYRAPRGLDRALFQRLTNGEWIDAHDNLILCGPTGVGKKLACLCARSQGLS
jgi:transposase